MRLRGHAGSRRTSRPALLLLAEGDDVLIAVRDLDAGPAPDVDGRTSMLTEPVPRPQGGGAAPRRRRASRAVRGADRLDDRAIAAGGWVHTHNLASDYIATFAHRGGER